MNIKAKYIKVEKSKAHQLLQFLKKDTHNKMELDLNRKILYEENFVLFPYNSSIIKSKYIKRILKPYIKYKIVFRKPISSTPRVIRSLKDSFSKELSKKLIKFVPNSYDVIGDIAILEFDRINMDTQEKYVKLKEKISERLLALNRSISTIYEKESEIKGVYRLRDLKRIKGEDKSETIHKENNCQFKLDVKKTYFTPRLVFERKRLSSLNYKVGEKIIDLFAGVGPISIEIAKNHNVIINAFDVNPDAYYYLKENINLNKVEGKIIAHQLDVIDLLDSKNEIGRILENKSNRIIMNLPENALDYIQVACFLLDKSGGFIHLYQFCEKPLTIKKSIQQAQLELKKIGWQIEEITNAKVVKPYSPNADLTVLDLKVKKITN
ncbi:MAG: class I SAM-dependent methyltransferase family protein [Candidatus Thorarchaeota archaeon]